MQADEGVGIEPMAAGTVAPVHHHDVDLRPGDQRTDERHPGRAGADNQIVRLISGMTPPGGLPGLIDESWRELRYSLPSYLNDTWTLAR